MSGVQQASGLFFHLQHLHVSYTYLPTYPILACVCAHTHACVHARTRTRACVYLYLCTRAQTLHRHALCTRKQHLLKKRLGVKILGGLILLKRIQHILQMANMSLSFVPCQLLVLPTVLPAPAPASSASRRAEKASISAGQGEGASVHKCWKANLCARCLKDCSTGER